jgi:thiol:disulfide interchange protein DsbA
MLQRILMLILLSCAASFTQAQAPAFVEGVDYFPITPPQPTRSGDQIEVIEVFGYPCPHCANAAPVVTEWAKSKPADVQLAYLPAVFGGAYEAFARAFYAAELMGILERSHDKIFEALHTEKRPVRNLEDIGALYAEFGVTKEAFVATMTSFPVNAKIAESQQRVPAYGVEGTPTMIVNGKYRVVAPHGTESFQRMMQVVNFLVAKEREARKQG